MSSGKTELGKAIVKARKQAGYDTQEKLSAALGHANKTNVARWESGARVPSPETLGLLDKLLGSTLRARFAGGVDNQKIAEEDTESPMMAALAQMTGMLADMREEQRSMREERREWRALMHEFLRRMPVQTDELETLKAENTRLRGELSAAGAPDSSAVRKLAR